MKINNDNLISAWSNTSTPVCSFAGIHFSQGPEFQNLHKHKLDQKKRASGMAGKFFSISLDISSYQGKVVKSWEVHLGDHSKLTLIQTIHTCSHWITDTRYLCITHSKWMGLRFHLNLPGMLRETSRPFRKI